MMRKKYCLLLSAFLLFSGTPVSAVNWVNDIAFPNVFIDTDSYRTDGQLSSIDICLAGEEKDTFSTLQFDPSKRLWRSLSFVTRAKDGKILLEQKQENSPSKWNPVLSGTVGKSIYQHYIQAEMPDPQNSSWLLMYKNPNSHSSYYIDRKRTTYKDGYATFFMYAQIPNTENGPDNTIYRVKMNMAHKRIMLLSATEYTPDGKIKLHTAGTAKWGPLPKATPIKVIFQYLKDEVESGRLAPPAK